MCPQINKLWYRPNETIVLTLTVQNLLAAEATIPFSIGTRTENLYIPASEIATFTFTLIGTGSFWLNGAIREIGIMEHLLIEEPVLNVEIAFPEMARRREGVSVILKNDKPIPIDVFWKLWIDHCKLQIAKCKLQNEKEGSMTVVPNSTVEIREEIDVLNDGTITLVLSGDISGTYTKFVRCEERVDVEPEVDGVYKPGVVEIPFVVENKGGLDSEFDVEFGLERLATETQRTQRGFKIENLQVSEWCKEARIEANSKLKTKNYKLYTINYKLNTVTMTQPFFVPAQGSVTGSIFYNLDEGSYTFSYNYFRGQGESSFRVARLDWARTREISLNRGDIVVSVENFGANPFSGSLEIKGEGVSTSTPIELSIEGSSTLYFPVPALFEGSFTYTVRITKDGREIDEGSVSSYLTFEPQLISCNYSKGTLSLWIKNIGCAMNRATATLRLMDTTLSEEILIKAKEEKVLLFSFGEEDDLSSGTYTGLLNISGRVWLIPVFIDGWDIKVKASLNKPAYDEEESGTLTLAISNNGKKGTVSVVFRFAGNEKEEKLYPGTESVVCFGFPASFDKGKCFFGVYTESGRAILLDALYILPREAVTFRLDRQRFIAGDEVLFYIEGTGTAELSLPGTPSYIGLELPGTASFILDDSLTSGTYYIYWSNDEEEGSIPIDISGIEARILDMAVSSDRVYSGGDILLELFVSSNRAGTFTMRSWRLDPTKSLIPFIEKEVFLDGDRLVSLSGTISSDYSGAHSVVLGLFWGDTLLSLESEEFMLVKSNLARFGIDTPSKWVAGLSFDLSVYGMDGLSAEMGYDGAIYELLTSSGSVTIGSGWTRKDGRLWAKAKVFGEGLVEIKVSDGYIKGTRSIQLVPSNIVRAGTITFGSISCCLKESCYEMMNVTVEEEALSNYPGALYVGKVYKIEAVPNDGTKSLVLGFGFSQDEVREKQIDPDSLKVFRWENGWKEFSSVMSGNSFVVETGSLSSWCIMGVKMAVSGIRVYPNPYIHHKHKGFGLCVDGLLPGSVFYLYNIAGEKVAEKNADSSGKLVIYPELASGVYIWVGKDVAGEKRIGKVGVVK